MVMAEFNAGGAFPKNTKKLGGSVYSPAPRINTANLDAVLGASSATVNQRMEDDSVRLWHPDSVRVLNISCTVYHLTSVFL